MPSYILSGFNLTPPPGLTPGGRLHKFQQGTLDRLTAMAEEMGQEASETLRQRMLQAYRSPDSTKRAARSVDYHISSDRKKGVRLNITMGLFRETSFFTSLGGGMYHGVPYPIMAINVKNLIFFWKRHGRLFVGPIVTHPGFPVGDVPAMVLEEYGQLFRQRAVESVSRGLTELTSGSAQRANKPAVSRRFKR